MGFEHFPFVTAKHWLSVHTFQKCCGWFCNSPLTPDTGIPRSSYESSANRSIHMKYLPSWRTSLCLWTTTFLPFKQWSSHLSVNALYSFKKRYSTYLEPVSHLIISSLHCDFTKIFLCLSHMSTVSVLPFPFSLWLEMNLSFPIPTSRALQSPQLLNSTTELLYFSSKTRTCWQHCKTFL